MKKPSKIELFVFKNRIDKIKKVFRQTGDDTAETFVYLYATSIKKYMTITNDDFRKYFVYSYGWLSVIELKDSIYDYVKSYIKFEKENAEDLKEYNRLKYKLNIMENE